MRARVASFVPVYLVFRLNDARISVFLRSGTQPAMRFQPGDQCELVFTIGPQQVDAFAEVCGDFNPLHVDQHYAERSPAGGRVVHGALLSSYVSTLIGMHLPGAGAVWTQYHANFNGKVYVGDVFTLTAVVKRISVASRLLSLEITGRTARDQRVLQATARVVDMAGDDCPLSDAVKRAALMPASVTVNPPPVARNAVVTKQLARGEGCVLMTGGSGVIGAAVAQAYAAQGKQVILWGRDAAKLHAVQASLPTTPGQPAHEIAVIDLLQTEALKQLITATVRQFNVSIFIHLAHPHASSDLNHQWQGAVQSFSTITSVLLPAMQEQGGGNIIGLLSAQLFDVPVEKFAAYTATKLALLSLLRSIAKEAGAGIRANAVSPAVLNTPYSANMPFAYKQLETVMTPLQRLCEPEDIANLMVFLSSDQAAFINGANIPLTGGRWMP